MATTSGRRGSRHRHRAFPLDALSQDTHPIPLRPVYFLDGGYGGPGAGEYSTPGTTRGAGPTDYLAASGPEPSRWDRLVTRLTRNREPSPAVKAANETLTVQIDQYNRVREIQKRPLLRRDDFVDILDRPPDKDDIND